MVNRHLKLAIAILIATLTAYTSWASKPKPSSEKQVWIFAYFNNNGEDGLHLAFSRDGLSWEAINNDKSILKPTAGNDRLMRDPCIIRGGDGKFHMVWTVSWNERGVGYASSTDLVTWSEQRYLPVMEHEPATLNAWAPEVTYDSNSKLYMIYWASTIPNRFPMVGVNPNDKYNHRLYYTTTKDFQAFAPTKLLYNKGFSVIDATILKDGNGYIMFLKNENDMPAEKNLRIARSKKLAGSYSSPSQPITGKYWAEGPTALKVDGSWVVYFDKYMEGKYGAIRSTNLKDWEDISDKVKLPKGIRHGSVLAITENELQALIAKVSSLKK
jgi:beta-xylosidase